MVLVHGAQMRVEEPVGEARRKRLTGTGGRVVQRLTAVTALLPDDLLREFDAEHARVASEHGAGASPSATAAGLIAAGLLSMREARERAARANRLVLMPEEAAKEARA